jgi:hypothetical protein
LLGGGAALASAQAGLPRVRWIAVRRGGVRRSVVVRGARLVGLDRPVVRTLGLLRRLASFPGTPLEALIHIRIVTPQAIVSPPLTESVWPVM